MLASASMLQLHLKTAIATAAAATVLAEAAGMVMTIMTIITIIIIQHTYNNFIIRLKELFDLIILFTI